MKVDANGNDVKLSNDWDNATPIAPISILNLSSVGKLKALVDSYGYKSANWRRKRPISRHDCKIKHNGKSVCSGISNLHMGDATDPNNYPQGSDLNGIRVKRFSSIRWIIVRTVLQLGNLYVSSDIISDPGKIVHLTRLQ